MPHYEHPPIYWRELNGSKVSITSKEYLHNFRTKLGYKPAVRADVEVLDGPHAGTSYVNALIFPAGIRSLIHGLNFTVVGRVSQGAPHRKGQITLPWILEDVTTPTDLMMAAPTASY